MTAIDAVISRALATIKKPLPAPVPGEAEIAAAAESMVGTGYMPYDHTAFKKLAEWLAGAPTVGLLLSGPAGTGKTLAVRSLLKPRRLPSAADIVTAYRASQEYGDAFWYQAWGLYDSEQTAAVAVDDLGQEPVCVSFGQREDVLARVLCRRYEAWQRDRRHVTHVTTNLRPAELDARYGRRVTDRLREMCRLIEFTGTSKRAPGGSRRVVAEGEARRPGRTGPAR